MLTGLSTLFLTHLQTFPVTVPFFQVPAVFPPPNPGPSFQGHVLETPCNFSAVNMERSLVLWVGSLPLELLYKQ